MTEKQTANALINETSPYLLQHAYNPVAWYPWGEEAIERARNEDKPILLSIGYSACHWCHVMAHESFEDEETAGLMNKLFINIKVDREERPDLDRIYQVAQQLLTQRNGGWPLTMFLTPEDHIPFFGGTYFPPGNRYGMPGFTDVLQHVTTLYQQERDAINRQNLSLMEAFKRIETTRTVDSETDLTPKPLHASTAELTQAFDSHYGGFGGAPKFPTPTNLTRLLHHYELFNTDPQLMHMAVYTLQQMARGGIYDHIGGGFCRYSVDEKWVIPHFEKMLYDNGSLLALYADAWRLNGDPLFKKVALETADWLMREMQAPDGGYYSSLDADSEGEEGKFYVWTPDQVKTILNSGEYDLLAPHFGLDLPPNFEGKWHLHVNQPLATITATFALDNITTEKIIDTARHKLYEVRKKRIRPGRDEKILTSWNGLAIKGMAIAAMRFNRDDYLASAERSLAFIHDNLWHDDRLLATCKDGRAHLNAYLDDYAFMIDAILNVLAARWSSRWLNFAMQLADQLLGNFYDKESGGFFFTSHDHERLIQRRKDFMDDAIPAGNGVAAAALSRLGHLVNEPRYLEVARHTLVCSRDDVERMASAHNSLLFALEDYCFPPRQIILRGDEDTINEWQKQCITGTDTRTQVFSIPENINELPEIIQQRSIIGSATAYICEGFTCLEPITNINELVKYLKSQGRMS